MENSDKKIANYNWVLNRLYRKWTNEFINDLHAKKCKRKFHIGAEKQKYGGYENCEINRQ